LYKLTYIGCYAFGACLSLEQIELSSYSSIAFYDEYDVFKYIDKNANIIFDDITDDEIEELDKFFNGIHNICRAEPYVLK